MNLEEYQQSYLEGHNCHFETKVRPATRYFMYVKSITDNNYYEILLDEEHGESYSGWCESSYGIFEHNIINNIPEIEYVPLSETIITIDFSEEDINCELFEYSANGCDPYYASGYVRVSIDKFTKKTK